MTNVDEQYKKGVISLYEKAGIPLTQNEIANIDYADFGLNNVQEEALNLVVYVNNERYCAKEMVLLPNQTCPEHMHPSIEGRLGKQETFRCCWGKVFLYVEGDQELKEDGIQVSLPQTNKDYYTASKEIVLTPGEQYTIDPDTRHWFKAGNEGAVITEFSSPSDDASDIFTNPHIKRVARDKITS
ncbi:D-lyxose/D-mannose family sugar isomerase [Oceanobacillus manasiensis]|uniref:D-lyxose/D-mannose family sugar isomerase n=1 Tax=Oceanobacillus manasiensis TaxID=586413 RepID=UPI0005A65E5E|nr:D-lyxose/D-mannose family sugar isomerase [Oceanobacillus manasiensis]